MSTKRTASLLDRIYFAQQLLIMNTTSLEFEYDVAFSFAGEDRQFVEIVAMILKEKGVRIFYDKFEEANLWGKDLVIHFDVLYSKKAKYCIPFISKYYKQKIWTNHELKSALSRAVQSPTEYILPARFDETEIDGVRLTAAYIDLRNHTPEAFAEIILKKVNQSHTDNANKLETNFKASVKLSVGLVFGAEKRIPALFIEVINKSKYPRYFKEAFFSLSKPFKKSSIFSLINRDLIGTFPFKLECGETRSLHYYLDDIHGILPEMFITLEDSVGLTAIVQTTLDETQVSNELTVKEIKVHFGHYFP